MPLCSALEEEINNMKRELEKYGLQLPAFSKIGGILANELSVDEAAGDGCLCGERCCASACSRILAQPLNIKSRASKLREALRDALLQTRAWLQGLAQPLPSQQHQGFCISWACCRDMETFWALDTTFLFEKLGFPPLCVAQLVPLHAGI